MSGHDLVRLYRDDDHTPIRFEGGPCDGRTLTWSTSAPPLMIRLPVEPGPADAVLGGLLSMLAIVDYDQALDGLGFPKRDDGTLVYTARSRSSSSDLRQSDTTPPPPEVGSPP